LLCAACAGPDSATLPHIPADEVAAEKRTQQMSQAREYFAQLRQIENVAFRIRAANRADCKEFVAGQIGIRAGTVKNLPIYYRTFSSEALNLSWTTPSVTSVADDSPAAAAGIKVGDQVVSFNGEPLPGTDIPEWVERYLKKNGERPLEIKINRDGKEKTLTLQPIIACAIPVTLLTASEPNAATDGERIVIQSGILRLIRSDSDLATIIGHELAHANLGHIAKKRQNAFLGGLSGKLIDGGFLLGGMHTGGAFAHAFERSGARAYSLDFEREADYVGAYYATRAGYDISGAENIWRALGQESPKAIVYATTHPTSPERFILMKKAIAEITDKKRRQLPLEPELKATRVEVEPAATRENNY